MAGRGRPKKDFAAIAERAAQMADSHALAQRLDRIASKVLDKLEASIGEIKPANLSLAAAILLDKANQARGAAMAGAGNTTVNVQINGLDKGQLRAALQGVGDIARKPKQPRQVQALEPPKPRAGKASTDKDTTMGRVGTVGIGSPLDEPKPAIGEISPLGCIHPMPAAADTLPLTSPLLSASDAIIELQQLAQPDPALHGPAQGHGSTADDAKQAGGEGVASGARGSDCINSQPVINISKNALDQPLPSHDSH